MQHALSTYTLAGLPMHAAVRCHRRSAAATSVRTSSPLSTRRRTGLLKERRGQRVDGIVTNIAAVQAEEPAEEPSPPRTFLPENCDRFSSPATIISQALDPDVRVRPD
eukprot:1179953-Prorocentrum_minimum.AAC.5